MSTTRAVLPLAVAALTLTTGTPAQATGLLPVVRQASAGVAAVAGAPARVSAYGCSEPLDTGWFVGLDARVTDDTGVPVPGVAPTWTARTPDGATVATGSLPATDAGGVTSGYATGSPDVPVTITLTVGAASTVVPVEAAPSCVTQAPADQQQTMQVHVTSASTTGVSTFASGTVTTAGGAPVVGATVTASTSTMVSTTTDAQGAWSLTEVRTPPSGWQTSRTARLTAVVDNGPFYTRSQVGLPSGACAAFPPTTIAVAAPSRAVPVAWSPLCADQKVTNAAWRSSGGALLAWPSSTFAGSDTQKLGVWTWSPNGAASPYGPVAQNDGMTTDVRMASTAYLNITRSGSQASFYVTASRYSPYYHRWVRYTPTTQAVIQELVTGADGTMAWRTVKYAYPTASTAYTWTTSIGSGRIFRVFVPATSLIWAGASPARTS